MRRFAGIILTLLLTCGTTLGIDSVLPEAARDMEIEEKLNAQLPLDTPFINEMGKQVTLRECLADGKPAILQLSYFGCPMLCDLVSQGMLKSLDQLSLHIGQDFNVINISFDQRETKNDAYLKKKTYINSYAREGAAAGWHFLVGKPESVDSVVQATGFKYKWLETSQQFSHPAMLMVLTPDGRISRYLYGVSYDPQTLRLSLVEASQGKIGSTVDRVLMLCFQYDPHTGKYSLAATRLMQLGGIVTLIVLGGTITMWLVKERRAKRESGHSA